MAATSYSQPMGSIEGHDLNAARHKSSSSSTFGRDAAVKMPMSPRAPSPLTPPATGDAKVAHTSSGAADPSSLPLAARQSVSPCSRRFPIRDSPRNPFLLGGPADAGLFGPRRWNAQQRMASLPRRERGKMTYVFRGQRVTYADPYASSDSEDEGELIGASMAGRERTMDRLKPQVLFPRAQSVASISNPSSSSSSKKRTFSSAQSHALPRGAQQMDGPSYGSVKRQRYANITANNAALLDRLERAGWDSDEEDAVVQQQEECEEDEIDGTLLAPKRRLHDWQDSESEEDEAEVNPFLSTAVVPLTRR